MPGFRTDLKPLEIKQPEGPSYTLTSNCISWQKWSMVIGFSAREGLTLHDICYNDNGRSRSILYRASLTEMVVPYADPKITQARKNAFDVGEYGIGSCTNSLKYGCDCVGFISYLDGHLVTSRGNVLTIPNAICIHEEDFGILWKHTDRRQPNSPEVRRSRRLVISAVATVENYEYGYFWYFYLDGNIQFEVKLTGILSLGSILDGEKPKYGTVIAPLLYAPFHQHFFNVRLDWALDGIDNSIACVDIVAAEVDPVNNPFENAFYPVTSYAATEKEARGMLKLETMRTWKVANTNVKNACGDSVAYKFIPGDNSVPLAPPTSWWRKRAGFVDYHVWATPFDAAERFAAGDFPNQSTGGDGLKQWVEQDRSVLNTDVVMWYTFGHTHIPRPEDGKYCKQ
jgi:primary-amine oxidase